MTADQGALRAVYYPYARTMSETTLKRCVMLYDELLFVDPMSARVRAGLYAPQPLSYLPPNVAASLEEEWRDVHAHYRLLETEGLVRFVDPGPLLDDAGHGALVADALGADLADEGLPALFTDYPAVWSTLRSRIPAPAFDHLAHQIPARVLAGQVVPSAAGPLGLMLDGHPAAQPVLEGGRQPPDDGLEYAALLPYLAGSSIATTTALAVANHESAVPVTDSEAHFRLLGVRMARATRQMGLPHQVPGLAVPDEPADAYRNALVQQRVVDSVISHADWEALSLAEVLEYRERTQPEREAFRAFLAQVTGSLREEPWSPRVEAEIREALAGAQAEIKEHAGGLRDAYRSLFRRSLVGLSVSTAPALVATAFPGVAPLAALLFGGTLTGVLSEPVKELFTLWVERDRGTSGLAYLVDLPRKGGARGAQ